MNKEFETVYMPIIDCYHHPERCVCGKTDQSLKRELVEAFKKVYCNSDDCTKAWRKCPECNLITRAEATL